jgi:hypothetical protein
MTTVIAVGLVPNFTWSRRNIILKIAAQIFGLPISRVSTSRILAALLLLFANPFLSFFLKRKIEKNDVFNTPGWLYK